MKISILGTGAYGIALAKVFFENDNKVSMWTKFEEEADIIKLKRENINYFPGVKISRQIDITTNMEECIESSKIIVIALPMNAVRQTCKELAKYINNEQIICIATKGIENDTNKYMNEVVYEETKCNDICMISGPSFAIELVKNNELGLTVASESSIARTAVKICLENERVKVGLSKDIIGVEVASSVKNIFAIIMGMLDGLKKSDSTKASILSLLANDMRLIIELLGGRGNTVFSYAGLGDLLLTCMSAKSRNFTFGKYIGQGFSKDEALERMESKTVEGLYTLKSIKSILDRKEVSIKSIDMIYDIVYNDKKIENYINTLK